MKLCECGCGTPVGVSSQNRWDGVKRGQQLRFVKGHQMRVLAKSGDQHHNWHGGHSNDREYRVIHQLGHPRAKNGYVREHILVAERAMGKLLPRGAVVHHVDGNTLNNDSSNLVVCQSQGYHALLHMRWRALIATGHADWRKCPFCKKWSPISEMVLANKRSGSLTTMEHPRCRYEYNKARRAGLI